MLSIKWITDVDYYLNQSTADYYFRPGEPPGRWWGSGAKSLGLADTVTAKDLKSLCRGFAPSGQALTQNAGESDHQQAWDLTFSAPKSLSVLWSQAETPTRFRIRKLHEKAIHSALGYLTEVAIVTRRGKGGTHREPAKPIVAIFEHGSNRELEPQLHSHCVLLNVAAREDGTFGTILSQLFYKHKLTAGALYQSELACLLQTELGLRIQPEETAFSIAGVPKELTERYSTRSKQIRERLRSKGGHSAKAASTAALDTRKAKPGSPPPRGELLKRWQEINRQFGFSDKAVERLFRKPRTISKPISLWNLIREAAKDLLESQSYFSEQQLIRLVAKKSLGQPVPATHIIEQVRGYLDQDQDLVALQPLEHEPLFTTRQMLALEQELLATLEKGKADASHVVTKATVQRLLTESLPITSDLPEDDLVRNKEQREAVLQLVTKAGNVQVLEGMAGTGKTYTLSIARQAWEQAGYRVTGVALSAAAAANLQKGAGIESDTISMRLLQLDGRRNLAQHHKRQMQRLLSGKSTFAYDGPRFRLDQNTIVVVDEAGMVGTRQMVKLVDRVRRAGAKLVLVGDRRQLQPIEAGGPFAAIAERTEKADLQHVTRQTLEPNDPNPTWHRQAGKLIAAGQVAQAIKLFAERGRMSVLNDREEAMLAIVRDWSVQGIANPNDNIVLAGTRAEIAELNRRCQTARFQAGALAADAIRVGEYDFRIGDTVLVSKNSRLYAVKNGDRGVVLGFNRLIHTMAVRIFASDKTVFIPYRGFSHVQLGYAMTTHKAQGATVPSVYVLLGGPMQDRHLTYVQATRASESTRLYVDKHHAGPKLKHLLNQMVKERPKRLAHDFLPKSGPRGSAGARIKPPKRTAASAKSPLVSAMERNEVAIKAKHQPSTSSVALKRPVFCPSPANANALIAKRTAPESMIEAPSDQRPVPHSASPPGRLAVHRSQIHFVASADTPTSQIHVPAAAAEPPKPSVSEAMPDIGTAHNASQESKVPAQPKGTASQSMPSKSSAPTERPLHPTPPVALPKSQSLPRRALADLRHVRLAGTTDENVLKRVVQRYGRLPGGIVVEAQAGFQLPIESLAIDSNRPGYLLLNESLELDTGLHAEEVALLWDAVLMTGTADKDFGVVTQTEVIGTGHDSAVALTMMHADNALGGRIYGYDSQRTLWEPLPHCRNSYIQEAAISSLPSSYERLFQNLYHGLHPQIVLIVDSVRFDISAKNAIVPSSTTLTAALGLVNDAGALLTARSGSPLVEGCFPIIHDEVKRFVQYFAEYARSEPHLTRTLAYAELVSLLRTAKSNNAMLKGQDYVRKLLAKRQRIPTPQYDYTLRSEEYRKVAQEAARRLLAIQAPAFEALMPTTVAFDYARKAGDLDLFLECKRAALKWIEIQNSKSIATASIERVLPELFDQINDASHDVLIHANIVAALEPGRSEEDRKSLLDKAAQLCGSSEQYKRNAPTWCLFLKARACLSSRFDPIPHLAQVRASDPSTLQPYWTLRSIKLERHQSCFTRVRPHELTLEVTRLKKQLGLSRLTGMRQTTWQRLVKRLSEYEIFMLLDDIRRFRVSIEDYLTVASEYKPESAKELLPRLLATQRKHAPENVFSLDLLHRNNPFLDCHELLDHETPSALTDLYSQIRFSIGDYARITPRPTRLRRLLAPVFPLDEDAWWHDLLATNAKSPQTEASKTAILLAHEMKVRKLTKTKLFHAMQEHGTANLQAGLFFSDLQAAHLLRIRLETR